MTAHVIVGPPLDNSMGHGGGTSSMVAGGAPERAAFLKIVCGMNDADFSKYFLQAAFTGKSATPPKEASGSAAVKSTVGNSPGGMGFVKASEFPSGNPTVKAVKIDGLARPRMPATSSR